MSQLALIFGADEPAEPVEWTYTLGPPDRSGTQHYAHLIRWRHDPKETRARGKAARAAGSRSPGYQRRQGTQAEHAAAIVALFEDGQPRTFNAICVDLLGVTADVMMDTPLDAALWQLVEEERLAWACEEGAVFFLRADHIQREAA